MSDQPVSVVIPTYNRATLLVQALESVLGAIAAGDEVIVVDDGSTDNTQEVLAPFSSRIRCQRISNSGPSTARNHGLRAAKHDLVAFHDSDDLWAADKLRLQRQVMRVRPDVLFCFSDFGSLEEDGTEGHHLLGEWLLGFGKNSCPQWEEILGPGLLFSRLGILPVGRDDFRVHIGSLYEAQLEAPYVATITTLVRRSVVGGAFHFPEDLRWAEDWECFSRLSRLGSVAYLDCETAWQRAHSGSRLSGVEPHKKLEIRLKMLQRVWGNDPAFLERFADRYRRVESSVRLALAQNLLVEGRTREAREELARAGGGPLVYRMLASLPGPFARGLLSVRRTLRR